MKVIQSFSIARLPRIEFGRGTFAKLPILIRQYGQRVLLVTGGRSFQATENWNWLHAELKEHGLTASHCTVAGEPSPELINMAVTQHVEDHIDVVVGIGGGSALDAAKAIAGLLRIGDSVMDYLEGVGPERDYTGPAVPYIAVPTTAGTGSETTKNAVLSIRGKEGFKKSFRDDKLVAEYAVVDPDLLISCPPDLIAANGMDALTQLMESYTSLRGNPMTNALAVSGLRAARDGLLAWYDNALAEPEVTEAARTKMAYASMLSGITLAQVGLGSVHGLASPLGAFFPIPHGVVCGTLVAEATLTNIQAMRDREPDNPALRRYVRLAEIICAQRFRDPQLAWHMLVERLMAWTEHMQLARLAEYEVSQSDLDHIVAHSRGSSMKTNPIVLSDAELHNILERRL
ncbi:MAG: iron-containing alcohol dehydrogenase [Thiohalomonadales bacterium]|nr:iron-containing alcohol dehydrogenase [Thiohalomonadales bacterium]